MNDIVAHIAENMTRRTDICEHLRTLYEHARLCTSVLELGVNRGESTIAILCGVRESGGHLTSIDIDTCFNARLRVFSIGLTDYWTMIRSNDMDIDWKEPVDMLFIDTSHAYDHTLAELRKFEPLARRFVIMHDTVSNPPVKQAINEYFQDRNDVKMVFKANCNGLAVINKNK